MPVRPPFPRAPLAAVLLAGGAVAALAGCAPGEAAGGTAAARPAGDTAYGTVLGVRPVVARGSGPFAGAARSVELTVRDDAGTELQLAEPEGEALRAGDRVSIARGDRTRLARAAGRAPPPAVPVRAEEPER